MPLTRRELLRRIPALYGMGAAGAWPLRELNEDLAAPSASASATTTQASPEIVGTESASLVPAARSSTLLWDGISGVSRDYFNFGARLPWLNSGGDWVDAANVPQGTSSYGALNWPAAGLATASITPLVQRWYLNANTGIYLKCTANAAYLAARSNANPSLRPLITATLSDGSVLNLVCSGSGVTNLSASFPVVGQELTVQNFSAMVLQFALPNLAGRTVASATLKLYATRIYGTTTCKIFELSPPKIFDGGTPLLGIAAKYEQDDGIGADPAVYFATQFDEPGWRENHFPIGLLANDAIVLDDAELATPALRVSYHTGEFSPCYLNHMWSQRVPNVARRNVAGTLKTYASILPSQYDALNNQDCPSELYFRYYLKLGANYQCAVDGKKLPGLAGRYGYWHWSGTDKGYYQAVSGNGGSPTKGTRVANAAFPGGSYYSGWSMRHHAGVGPTDGNPYGKAVIASTYAYHAAMTGWYGDAWRWGFPSTGWINYEPDRWYCIEQYVKMNTISAPFDALGNGVGNANGVLRGWVDGVLAIEKTNVVFRKHPAIRIDEVWLDHYHGGTIPPEEPHTFEMANLVVATAYIGPMRDGPAAVVTAPTAMPLWLEAKPVNQWIAIAGTEMSQANCSAQAAAGLTDGQCRDIGYGNPRRGIFAYSGGTLKKSGSEMLLFGGGGAGGWAGNDVRGLRLEDDVPTWRTRVNAASARNVPPARSSATPYMLDGVAPNARHSYWQPQFNDAQNRFMTFGCVNTWNMDSGQFYTVDSVPLDAGNWAIPGTHPNVPVGRGWDGNWACKHPVTEDVYVAGAHSISKWSSSNNSWSPVWTSPRTDVDRGTAAIDPTGTGTLLRIGMYGASNVPLAIDIATGVATVGSFSGPYASMVDVGGYYAAGLVFDPVLGKFVLFQDDGYLYTITKVTTADWRVDRLSLSGVPPEPMHSSPAARAAIWGRMQYIPNLQGVCIIQAYDRPAYFVKTA